MSVCAEMKSNTDQERGKGLNDRLREEGKKKYGAKKKK